MTAGWLTSGLSASGEGREGLDWRKGRLDSERCWHQEQSEEATGAELTKTADLIGQSEVRRNRCENWRQLGMPNQQWELIQRHWWPQQAPSRAWQLHAPSGGGSVLNTSRAAPATIPASSARLRAASSITPPRATLTMRAPFFICRGQAQEQERCVRQIVHHKRCARDSLAPSVQVPPLLSWISAER